MKTVGIIGGSGFIGSHITKKFLEEGFNVKVSSTDISNKGKYQHLSGFSNSNNLEIVALDVENISMLENFVEGCQILIHGGTPFQLDVKNPQSELFDPTIKGTENFLQIISASQSVEKVVFIASVASYNAAFPMPAGSQAPDHLYTEEDTPFSDEKCHPYAQAKYHADQAVRKFVRDQANIGFEITSVFPAFVVGQPLSARQDSTSAGLQYLLKNKLAPDPFVEMLYEQNVEFALVDVNDVAESVYRSATSSGLHGKNYLLTSESWPVSDISLMLNNQKPEGSANIVYSNKLATQQLGVNFKPASIPLGQFGQE